MESSVSQAVVRRPPAAATDVSTLMHIEKETKCCRTLFAVHTIHSFIIVSLIDIKKKVGLPFFFFLGMNLG